jgi:hypothetical protein
MTSAPAMTALQQEFSDTSRSGVALYRRLAVGEASLLYLIGYEAVQTLLAGIPGILGLGLRSVAYPHLFKSCGKRPAIGRGTILRIPNQVSLGNGVLVDDYCTLDVRGQGASIDVGDRVSIGRFSTIAAKGGTIRLGAGCNIGSYCRVATN